MKICFTLDDVIRAKTVQIGKMYQKYIHENINLDELDFSTDNYAKIFGFENEKDFKQFLYVDYPFEIFAEANTVEKMLDKKLNLWHINTQSGEYDENIEVSLSNPMEFNASIGYTYFFLSKIATRIRDVYFPTDSSTIWDRCDVLVTASPKLLENKPDGKIAIKIETDYNKEITADYTYDKLSDFLDDKEIINTLISVINDRH